MTLLSKTYNPEFSFDAGQMTAVFGAAQVRQSYAAQLASLKAQLPDVPMLLGEFGVPFDLDGGRAYRDGDFSAQIQALDGYYAALDQNLLGGTIWNYTPDNSNQHGDLWNGEDLSIWSLAQGGRGLPAIVRPYACATAGEPLDMQFDLPTRTFRFRFRHDPAVSAPTELFVPELQYEHGYTIAVSDGTYSIDRAAQRVHWAHTPALAEHTLTIRPNSNLATDEAARA
jgi:hypothetical protein